MIRNILVGKTWPELGLYAAAMWWGIRPLGHRLALRLDVRTPISDADRVVLSEAFHVLGAERVRAGLKSMGHTWGECFLSYALAGAPFGFRPALEPGWRTRPTPHLTLDQTNAVVRSWDRKEAAFRAFAGEWLRTGHPRPLTASDSRSLHEPAPSVSIARLAAGMR